MTSVCQWSVCMSRCVCVCVPRCHSSCSVSSWVQGACLFHITSIKVVSIRLPHKSLFTSPTLLQSLSGDAKVTGTVRYCLTMRAKRGDSCTCCVNSTLVCSDVDQVWERECERGWNRKKGQDDPGCEWEICKWKVSGYAHQQEAPREIIPLAHRILCSCSEGQTDWEECCWLQ